METFSHNESREALRQFAVELRHRIDHISFTDRVAARYWSEVQSFAVANIELLEQALRSLNVTADQADLADDVLAISQDTLSWAEGDELAYADALAEAGKVLAERLHYAQLLLASHRVEVDVDCLRALHTSPTPSWEQWTAAGVIERKRASVITPPLDLSGLLVGTVVGKVRLRGQTEVPPSWATPPYEREVSTPALRRGFIMMA